jgi:hypothetical protein
MPLAISSTACPPSPSATARTGYSQIRNNRAQVNNKIYENVMRFTQVLYATNTGLNGIPDE